MKEKLSHLANLISIIYEDGKLDKLELEYLYGIAERYDIDESEIITILNQQSEFEFIIPESMEERKNQLKDLSEMMRVDGIISPGELDMLKKIGKAFSIDDKSFEEITAS